MTITELHQFAEKVERVCDFLIAQAESANVNGQDLKVLKDLKEKAADIHTGVDGFEIGLIGLADAVGAL